MGHLGSFGMGCMCAADSHGVHDASLDASAMMVRVATGMSTCSREG